MHAKLCEKNIKSVQFGVMVLPLRQKYPNYSPGNLRFPSDGAKMLPFKFILGPDYTMSFDGLDKMCGFEKSTFPLSIYGGQLRYVQWKDELRKNLDHKQSSQDHWQILPGI